MDRVQKPTASMDASRFRWREILIPAFGPSVLFGLGKGAVLPVIALTALELNASHAVAGAIVSLIGLGSLINNIPAALITNRFGERRSLVGAALFSILALILCVFAGHPAVLALGVLMLGMATSVFYLARQTYLMEAVPASMRARAFSTLGGTQRIGMFTGPFIAAGVMHFFGLPGAYWTAILALAGTGILCFSVPDLQPAMPPASRRDADLPIANPRMWDVAKQYGHVLLTLGMGVALIGALRASRQIAIPLWAESIGLSATATAVVFGVSSAVDVLLFYPAGKVMDLYGRLWVALPCALVLGLSFVTIPLTASFIPLILVAILMGVGNGIGSGIVMTLGADASPVDGRTQFLGLWRLISDVGTSAGPFFLSAMTALISLGAGIVSVGMLGFAAAVIFWRKLPHRRGQ